MRNSSRPGLVQRGGLGQLAESLWTVNNLECEGFWSGPVSPSRSKQGSVWASGSTISGLSCSVSVTGIQPLSCMPHRNVRKLVSLTPVGEEKGRMLGRRMYINPFSQELLLFRNWTFVLFVLIVWRAVSTIGKRFSTFQALFQMLSVHQPICSSWEEPRASPHFTGGGDWGQGGSVVC